MTIATTRIHATLPMFRLESRERCVLYTPPGHLAVVDPDVANEIYLAWNAQTSPEEATARQVAAWLKTRAEQASLKWRQWSNSPFRPECLTVYLSNQCQLACSYCYVAPERQKKKHVAGKFPLIREEIALAAGKLVAQNCAEQKKPFHLVLHGGGEPTLHWDLVERLETSTRRIAQQFGLEWRGHLATNGIFSAQKAQWIARHFSSIGLSCDGPPDIQNRQRPFPGGKTTSEIVKRTAEILKNAGGKFTIRATITPQTMDRQAEIVAYLHENLLADDIRFEPLYSVRKSGLGGFNPNDATRFVEHFLEAQKEARSRGISLSFSGARLEELHGPYCDVLRNVLHLNPDGTASACFFSTDGQKKNGSSLIIGHFDKSTAQFVLDSDRIEAHRQDLSGIPKQCFDCLNIYHCARGCPELCSLSHSTNIHNHFRCHVQQQLATAWIFEAAEHIVTEQQAQVSIHNSGQHSAYKMLEDHLHGLPSGIDADTIVRQWEAVRTTYQIEKRRMPSPIWAEREFEHDGLEAWQQLCHTIPLQNHDKGMAIYIHIPFCERRCGFCDCLSLPLGKQQRKQHENSYLRKLLAEIQAWSSLSPLQQRPISTIHFGGGTPNCLSAPILAELLDRCRTHFHVTSHTEFALESTSSLLNSEHLNWLRQLGFSRLHVGVQTLEEPLRNSIGRREGAEIVLEKLARSLEMGFITSVDVMYGLPGQNVPGLVETLKHLIEIGIHGVSLYRLNRSQRNRRFFEKHPQFSPNALYDYVMCQAAEQILTQAGYDKNHFTHFARSEDRNLYYTHAGRGEDLLALGTSADGVFGDYFYRHPEEYKVYIGETHSDIPTLEGGIRETALEHHLSPVISALLTGNVSRHMLQECQTEPLLERWRKSLLIREDSKPGRFSLTANGSWFVNDMIAELKNLAGI